MDRLPSGALIDESREKEINAIHNLASTLQTGLDRRTIAVLLELVERNIDPESIADGSFIYLFVETITLSNCAQHITLL
jgi:hypothetical protein